MSGQRVSQTGTPRLAAVAVVVGAVVAAGMTPVYVIGALILVRLG